jgi:transcriptional regulator with XRE-family HTH domain
MATPVQTEPALVERRRRFGKLLKQGRCCIPVDTPSLGGMLRLPTRVGRHVTQEELAEAIGVSRVWYTMLETGRPARASVALLERICNTLMLDERQRAAAFELGVPVISSRSLEMRTAAILESSDRIRSTARRLLAVSTIDQALTIAAEDVSMHFQDAELVFFVRRRSQGRWERTYVVDHGMGGRKARFYQELAASLSPARFDEVVLYPALSEAGDLGTPDSFGTTSIAAVYEATRARHKLDGWDFLHARIHTRGGATAGIAVNHRGKRGYSEVDRAILSGIASLASLALP